MKRTSLILVLSVIAILQSSAQKCLLGVKTGANFTNVTPAGAMKPSEFRAGVAGGLTFDCFFTKKTYLNTALMYEQRGYRFAALTTDNSGSVIDGIRAKYNFNYISIPVNIGTTFGNSVYGFVSMGIIPAILTGAKLKMQTFESLNLKEKIRDFDISGSVEAGIGYKLEEKYWLFTSLTFQRSFIPFSKSEYTNSNYNKRVSYGMALSVGAKYVLSK